MPSVTDRPTKTDEVETSRWLWSTQDQLGKALGELKPQMAEREHSITELKLLGDVSQVAWAISYAERAPRPRCRSAGRRSRQGQGDW